MSELKAAELGGINGICLDIDDTLSTHGKLTAAAFDALWALKGAGFFIVPITGRPAGWCDHIARFWPVDAVVGENGAFTFYMEGGVRRRVDTVPGDGTERRRRLDAFGAKVRARFPEARWASDQAYREYDLAIDVAEDVPRWSDADIQELLKICAKEGAHAKLSSIHVNAWFGRYDKRAGLEHWRAQGAPGISGAPSLKPGWDSWIFIGDSPNDEPMFAFFKNSVGVANLTPYLKQLSTRPRWMTAGSSGEGFVELAQRLIASRNG